MVSLFNTPIEDIGLKWRIWKHLAILDCHTIGDLVSLPENILAQYEVILLEGVERVKRENAQPQ